MRTVVYGNGKSRLKWDLKQNLHDDIMWPDVKKLIENYKKFLTYPHDSCKMVVINLTTME